MRFCLAGMRSAACFRRRTFLYRRPMTAIQKTTLGYPLAVCIAAKRMTAGGGFTQELVTEAYQELFRYFDAAIYRRFSLAIRYFLLEMAPFDSFDAELARVVSGNNAASAQLDWIQRNTTMLRYDGIHTFYFWPGFREFLLWEMDREYSGEMRQMVFRRGGLYYELRDEYATPGMWRATSGTDPKITVSNHSNIPVKVSFAFTPKITGMGGTFFGLETHDNAIIIDSAEGTAYANAPSKQVEFSAEGTAIDADGELGMITVTVAKAITAVSTSSELFTARDAGGIVVLANDIDLNDMALEIYNTKTAVILDLNGHTLTSSSTSGVVKISEGAVLTVVNGSLTSRGAPAVYNSGGTVAIEGCTLTSGCATPYGVVLITGVMSMKDSVIKGKEDQSGRSVYLVNYTKDGFDVELTLSGNVEIDGDIYVSPPAWNQPIPTVKALAGTYNFDVSSYVDTTLYDVTNDGAAWIVTAK